MTIHDIFMNESLNDFLKPTRITIIAFFVFLTGFFYLYYSYGLLDTINAFLVGDPAEYRDPTIPYVADVANPWSLDPWGLGIGLQAAFSIFLIHFAASLVSWIFCKLAKK